MASGFNVSDATNLEFPLACDKLDEEIQARIKAMPSECPLCHKFAYMQLSYTHESNREDVCLSYTIYELHGHCFSCRIDWEFRIKKRVWV